MSISIKYIFGLLIGIGLLYLFYNWGQNSGPTSISSESHVDRLINFIAMIATTFGVMMAIAIAFFTIRQINVEKEINTYKDEIRKQKEIFETEVTKTKQGLTEDAAWAKEKKAEISGLLDSFDSLSKRELKELQGKIEDLEKQVAIKKGIIRKSPGYYFPYISGSFVDSGSMMANSSGSITCKKCGEKYIDPNSNSFGSHTLSPTVQMSSPFPGEPVKTECPYCNNIN